MSARRIALFLVVLFGVLGAAVLITTLAMRRTISNTPSATVLVFDVPSSLEEAQAPSEGSFVDLLRRDHPTVWTLASGIREAATDSRVEALVLHIDEVDWGWAKVSEIREAIQDFSREGKPVYAALAGGGEREYLLASAADMIASPPLALLQLDGLTASALFMRGTLNKVGVKPHFAQAGRYKSAVEGWTHEGMSPPAREALQTLVDDQFDVLVDSLSSARGIPPDSIARLLDRGPFGAREAIAYGLIDTLLHRSDLDSMVVADGDDRRSTLSLERYVARLDGGRGGRKIALVTAVGVIAEGRSRNSPADGQILGAETLIKALRDARNRSSIDAVVLRIDSPGGSAPASDEIWQEVRRCAQRKPVIASFSDLAASGGYYIAVPADSIVAEPGTLTGSIGAFGGKLNLLGLYRKLGLNVESVSRGRHAGMFSPFTDFSAEESLSFQAQMDEVYRVFLSRVSEGRHRPVSEIDPVAQGRVWTGVSARRLGLVDALGGLPRAIEMARERAGIDENETVTVEVYPRVERSFFQRFFSEMLADEEELATVTLPPVVRAWLAAAAFPSGVALALMPWSIEIR